MEKIQPIPEYLSTKIDILQQIHSNIDAFLEKIPLKDSNEVDIPEEFENLDLIPDRILVATVNLPREI